MASYACLLLFFGFKDSVFELMTATSSKWQITITVFAFTFVLPSLNIYLMYKLKRIHSITLSNQNERTFPFIMTAIFYFGLFYLFFDLRIWETIKIFVFCAGSAILLTALINLKFKISAHMVGIGGLIGMMLSLVILLNYDLMLYIILGVIASGLVGASRLYLKEHTPSQVYLGFLLGVFCQFILFLPLQQINLNF
jgi:membrane-associated phospholipid phosphatase